MAPITPSLAADAPPDLWARFSRELALLMIGLVVAVAGGLVLIDPYATGRPGLVPVGERPLPDPFAAHMARAGDPRFDSAIVGNSHVQMLRPERLDRLTAASFVSLMIQGSLPGDTLDVARVFLDRHAGRVNAMVIGADQFWCAGTVLRSEHFPGWLYSGSVYRYVVGLLRPKTLQLVRDRVRLLFRPAGGRERKDGYASYDPDFEKLGLADSAASGRRLAEPRSYPTNATGRFPAIEGLREMVAGLPPDLRLVLLRTPIYRTGVPDPDSAPGRIVAACAAALAEAAASRPRTAFVDLVSDGRYTQAPENFYDHSHYREAAAIEIEKDVAAALARLGPDRGLPAVAPRN